MSKKIAALLILFIILLQVPSIAGASPSALRISVDGKALSLSQPPLVVNSTTLVPIAPIFKEMGLTLAFDKANGYITGSNNKFALRLQPGSTIANVNGITVLLDEAVKVVNGATLVPLRFVSESLGATVSAAKNNIYIYNEHKKTMYDLNFPLKVSGNYVKNISTKKENFSEVNMVDFFYYPSTKTIGVEPSLTYLALYHGSIQKYTDLQFLKSTYNGGYYIGSAVKNVEYEFKYATVANTNYNKIKAYYESKAFLDKVRGLLKAQQDEAAASLNAELKANKNRPLKVTATYVTFNSIDTPEVNLTIKNLSTKTIVAYQMTVSVYDDFDRPVNRFLSNSNVFKGISQSNNLRPGESQTDTWTLDLYDLGTKAKSVKITAVKFSDGSSWKL